MSRFSRDLTSTLDDVRDLLDHEGLTVDSVAILSAKTRDALPQIPILPLYVLASMFRDLSYFWGDSGAVPTSHVTPFVEKFLPELRNWLESNDTFDSRVNMDKVVHAFQACQRGL